MNSRKLLVATLVLFNFVLLVPPADRSPMNGVAAAAEEQPGDAKFDRYRKAIQSSFGIDIKNFRGELSGGRADGKPLTQYQLDELLTGIKVELEHTTDRMLALEIATDHLEEFPDYYTRLLRMEEDAEREHSERQKNFKR